MTSTKALRWKATFIVLCGCYFFLFLLPVMSLVKLFRRETGSRMAWQKSFHSCLIMGALLRLAYFVLCTVEAFNVDVEIPDKLNFILNVLPTFFFFTLYLILLFFWAEIYHSGIQGGATVRPSIVKLRPYFIGVNTIMYLFTAIFFVLDIVLSPHKSAHPDTELLNVYQEIIISFSASCYILCAIAFFIYGVKLYQRLSAFRLRIPTLIIKIWAITLIVVICFLIRAAMVVLSVRNIAPYCWYIVLVYYAICEASAVALMFYILHSDHGKRDASYSSNEDAPLMNNTTTTTNNNIYNNNNTNSNKSNSNNIGNGRYSPLNSSTSHIII